MRCYKRDGGTSHIAPPDMNSYIKKYALISTVTCEFVHMNSYVSDPCLVYKKMATADGGGGGGGWSNRDGYERHIGPWFKSPKPGYICLANLANCFVAVFLAISTYIKPNI